MLPDKIRKLLHKREFVYVATSNLESKPNAAPKFMVKVDNNFVYLIDYVVGKTWENIKINPRVSLTFMDNEELTGYQINGHVTLITMGLEFDLIINELRSKKVSLTVERLVKGVQRGKKHNNFEVDLPENGVVLKVKVDDVVEICPSGKLKRDKVSL